LLTWPWPRPLREHSLITRLRLHMADPCTKSEVSSVSRCGDSDTCRAGVQNSKILKRVVWPWPRPFQGRFFFGRVGLDVPNTKSLGSPVTKLWMAMQNAENGEGALSSAAIHRFVRPSVCPMPLARKRCTLRLQQNASLIGNPVLEVVSPPPGLYSLRWLLTQAGAVRSLVWLCQGWKT